MKIIQYSKDVPLKFISLNILRYLIKYGVVHLSNYENICTELFGFLKEDNYDHIKISASVALRYLARDIEGLEIPIGFYQKFIKKIELLLSERMTRNLRELHRNCVLVYHSIFEQSFSAERYSALQKASNAQGKSQNPNANALSTGGASSEEIAEAFLNSFFYDIKRFISGKNFNWARSISGIDLLFIGMEARKNYLTRNHMEMFMNILIEPFSHIPGSNDNINDVTLFKLREMYGALIERIVTA
jgi:hypothetical protein